jgi:hypothetical protein
MLNLIRNTVSNFRLTKAKQDANNFLAAAGITGQVQSQAIYNLVNDLQTSGLWSKMKAVYPMVTDNYNQFYYSEDFSNANWYRINNTITTNSTTAPNGTLTADTFADNATNNIHQIAANYTLTGINGNNTASIYAKANTLNWICVTYFISGAYQKTFFDLQNGVVGTNASGNTATIENVGNGWYRCSITRNFNATGTFNVGFHTASADNVDSYAGSGQSLYIWGAQFQAGTPLAYQPILTTPSAFMASQMKYNLKDARDLDAAFRLTWSGGWTYSANGATPNGTNAFADTKLATNILGLDSAHLSLYSRTNSNGTIIDIGSSNSASAGYDFQLVSRFSNINYSILNSKSPTGFAQTTSLGFALVSRVLSTGYAYFLNNSKTSVTKASDTRNSFNIYIAARNTANVAEYFSNRETAFASIGDGLTDQDAQLLNQITEKYQVALSRGVQAAQSFYYNSAYSNEANTYLYSTQITGTTQVSAINTLINGLKANNLWTKMKAVYPFVTDKWNLYGYTEDLTNVAWAKSNVSATLTGTFLGNNVYKLADTTNTNVVHLIAQGPMVVSNTYTVSVNFKKAEYDYAQIFEGGAVFNLANGTVQSSLGSNATMVDLGDGWYRCSVTVVAGAANIHIAANKTATSGYAYLSTIGYGIFMSAPQIQYGTIASPYQVISGTNSNTINQTAVAAQMKFNLVNPQDSDAAFRLAFSGGWTYSTNGAQPNGTNGYADTKLVPNTDLTLNNSSFSIYSRTAFTPLTNQSWGVTSSGSFLPIIGATIDTTTRINGFSYSYMSPDVMNSATGLNFAAMFLLSRTSATSAKLFRNITQLASTSTQGQASQPTTTFTFGALRNSASFQDYNNFQYGFAHISNGLSDAEIIIFYQLVQQFQTNLTRQV